MNKHKQKIRFCFFIVIGILFISLLMTNCFPQKENYSSNEKKDLREDFDKFRQFFYSDSLFQLSRIIFPLENDLKIEKEYIEALKDSSQIKISNENNFVPHTKDNWITLSDDYFKNDSIATIDGVTYKRRFYKTNNFVEENILNADDEFVMIKLKFRLMNKKWYLVDFIDGFAN